MSEGWIGVDLDGTLVTYDGWKGAGHIGEPVPLMVERVKSWLGAGHDVRIFTARVSDGPDAARARVAIQLWCLRNLGQTLPVTNVKDFDMWELYDDRAVQVEKNTGRLVGSSTRGLG